MQFPAISQPITLPTINFDTNYATLYNKYKEHQNANPDFSEMTINTFKKHIPVDYKRARCKSDIAQYKFDKENVQPGTLVAIMVFKQNINLNRCQAEVNQQYYNRATRGFFSIVLFYRHEETVKKFVFSFVTDNLSKKCTLVMEFLNHMFDSQQFKDLPGFGDISTVKFWSDDGTTFRCYEMLDLMLTFSNNRKLEVHYNYFGERHGKGDCDQFFSLVSRAHDEYSRTWKSNNERSTAKFIETTPLKFKKVVNAPQFVDVNPEPIRPERKVEAPKATSNLFDDDDVMEIPTINLAPQKQQEEPIDVEEFSHKTIVTYFPNKEQLFEHIRLVGGVYQVEVEKAILSAFVPTLKVFFKMVYSLSEIKSVINEYIDNRDKYAFGALTLK
eukprot:gene10047-12316_t